MIENRKKFIRKMIKLAFEEICHHKEFPHAFKDQPDFPTVVTQYGGKVSPRLTIDEVMEVLPEFDKKLKKYKGKIKLP